MDLLSGSRVILSLSQLSKPRDHSRMIVRVGTLEFIKKLTYRAIARYRLIEFYAKFHRVTTSILMYFENPFSDIIHCTLVKNCRGGHHADLDNYCVFNKCVCICCWLMVVFSEPDVTRAGAMVVSMWVRVSAEVIGWASESW